MEGYDINQAEQHMKKASKKTGHFFTGIVGARIGVITIGLVTPYINEIKGCPIVAPQNNKIN